MRVARLIGRRILFLAPLLFGISLVTFFLIRLIPGDPAYLLAGDNASPQAIEVLHAQMGLDKPIWQQYLIYTGRALHGDFGVSWVTNRPVSSDFVDRIPATLDIALPAWVIGVALGMAAGVLCAGRPGSLLDRANGLLTVAGISIPNFWLALILILAFFFALRWAPPPLGQLDIAVLPPPVRTHSVVVDSVLAGRPDAFLSALKQLMLPVLTLAFFTYAQMALETRASMLSVLDAEYIRYARAAGLPESAVRRDALRNALIPVITRAGIIFSFLLGGTALVEVVFAWGGVGAYALQSAVTHDFAPIQGFVLISATFAAAVYAAVDILYAVADPRIEF